MEISEDVDTCHVQECKTTNKSGIFNRLRKSFRLTKKRERTKPKKTELIQQGVDYCNEIAELKCQLQIKNDEINTLEQQKQELNDFINKILEEKGVSGSNVIIGDDNVMIVDVDLSHIKKKINSLVEIYNDDFNALADRHAEHRLKLESIEVCYCHVISVINKKKKQKKNKKKQQNKAQYIMGKICLRVPVHVKFAILT